MIINKNKDMMTEDENYELHKRQKVATFAFAIAIFAPFYAVKRYKWTLKMNPSHAKFALGSAMLVPAGCMLISLMQ